MKKRIITLALVIVLAFSLCGCGMSTGIVFKDNGDVDVIGRVDLDAEKTDAMYASFDGDASELLDEGYQLVEENGVKYYRYEDIETISADNVNGEIDAAISKDYIIMTKEEVSESLNEMKDNSDNGSSEFQELLDAMTYTLYVTYTSKITKTNGELSKDKKTATWDMRKCKDGIYAFTENYKDTKKPTVTGVKNGATYKKSVKLKYKDNSVIASAKLDGKKVNSGKKVTAKGSHTLVVKDIFDNAITVQFTIK